MAMQEVAAAMQRTERALRRRPSLGLHDDATGVAHWESGTRVVARHASGRQVTTDMPPELGGEGQEVTPGWLMRAGLASCCATTIAMAAARTGIELDELEVRADSRSDVRGVFGMADGDGSPVFPGLLDVRMRVRIAARGVAPERLQALVEESRRRTPMLAAMQSAVPVALQIEIGGD